MLACIGDGDKRHGVISALLRRLSLGQAEMEWADYLGTAATHCGPIILCLNLEPLQECGGVHSTAPYPRQIVLGFLTG